MLCIRSCERSRLIQIAVCLSVKSQTGGPDRQTDVLGSIRGHFQVTPVGQSSTESCLYVHRQRFSSFHKIQFSCLLFAGDTRISSMSLAASGMSMFMREGGASKQTGNAGTEQVWWGWGRGRCSPLATEPAAGMQCAGGGLPLCTGAGCAHSCAGGNLLRRSQVLSAEHMLSIFCSSTAFWGYPCKAVGITLAALL